MIFFAIVGLMIILLMIVNSAKKKEKWEDTTNSIELNTTEIVNELADKGIFVNLHCLLNIPPYIGRKANLYYCRKEILLDEENQYIVLTEYSLDSKNYRILRFEDLLDCEIIEDNDVLKKASIGKAIIGGVIAGGAGAIIGGAMGKNQHYE